MKVMGMDVSSISGACSQAMDCDRLLQTGAVITYLLVFFNYTSLCGLSTFFVFLFSPFFLLAFLYAYWYYQTFDHPYKGGYNTRYLKSTRLWAYFHNYFPIRLHKTADLDTSKNYIFVTHPNGILHLGSVSMLNTASPEFDRLFPGITSHILCNRAQFYFPLTRELLMFSGFCADDKRTMEWVLRNKGLWARPGQACVVVAGRNEEILEHKHGKMVLMLKSRRDIFRTALENGTSLVPVFTFGESDLYIFKPSPSGSILGRIQHLFRNITSLPFPILSGRGISRYSCGFLPMRKTVHVVIGKPVDVQRVDRPNEEQVNQVLDAYVRELENLFNEHKARYLDDKNTVLTIQ